MNMTDHDKRKMQLRGICTSEFWPEFELYLKNELDGLRQRNDIIEDVNEHHRIQGRIAQVNSLLELRRDIEAIDYAVRKRE